MEHSKGKLVVVYTGEVALGAGFEIDRAKSPIRCFQMICNTADKRHQDYHVPKINANAQRLVKCWNEYDSLKAKADVCDEVVENLLHIIRLLCHPGSHVMAKDIDSAKEIIAKAGKNALWGI